MKKGQLQIQETILVVFVFIVIISLGLVFFYRFQLQAIQQDISDYNEDEFANILISFPDLAEVGCSFNAEKANCMDAYKLISFQSISKKRSSYFFKRLGYMNITVYSLYPSESSVACEGSSTRACGVWKLYSRLPEDRKLLFDKTVQETPISLYYPDTDSYGIGKLVVEAYGL